MQHRRRFRIRGIITFLTLFSGTLAISLSGAAYAGSTRTPTPTLVHSAYKGLCMEVYNNGSTANSKVDAYMCNNTPAQNWTTGYGNGEIRHTANGKSMCLGVTGNNLKNDEAIVMLKCKQKGHVQKSVRWTTQNGQLENKANKNLCLTLPGDSRPQYGPTFGLPQLGLFNCSFHKTGQRWTIQWGKSTTSKTNNNTSTPTTSNNGSTPMTSNSTQQNTTTSNTNGAVSATSITNGYGQCLGTNDNHTGPNTPVQATDCGGGIGQSWNAKANSEITVHGVCLGTDQNGTDAGRAVTTLRCKKHDNIQSSVTWTRTNGGIVNQASGMCLTSPGYSEPAGVTQLILEPCDGRPGQQWNLN